MLSKFQDAIWIIKDKIKNTSIFKKIIIILTIICILVGVSIMIYKKMDRHITGQEWFFMQADYIDTLREFSTSMDNVVALYLNDNISADDYNNHMSVLRLEYDIIMTAYEDAEKEHPVKVRTHDYYTKLGSEATKECMIVISKLIDECLKENTFLDKDKLIYVYLAYSQEITTYMSEYMTAFSIINYNK